MIPLHKKKERMMQSPRILSIVGYTSAFLNLLSNLTFVGADNLLELTSFVIQVFKNSLQADVITDFSKALDF